MLCTEQPSEKISQQEPRENRGKWSLIPAVILVIIFGILYFLYTAKQNELVNEGEFVQLNPDFIPETEAEIEEIKKMIEEDQNDSSLWRSLGLKYYALGKYTDAIDALNQSILINPFDAYSFEALGTVHKDRGDLIVAEENFKKAISRDPRYVNGYIVLTDFYRSQERFDQAQQTYLTGIENTNDSFIIKRYANMLEYLNRYQDAIDYLRLAQTLEPENTSLQQDIDELEEKIEQQAP